MRRWAKITLWILAGWGALFLVLIAAAIGWRLPLAGWVLRNALADAGASPREVRVTDVELHHVTISPLEVAWKGQQVRVASITLDRPNVFSRSLGHIRLDGITVVLDLSALRTTRKETPVAAKEITGPERGVPSVTFDDLSVSGGILLQGNGAGESLTFDVQAKPDASGRVVQATVNLKGPGATVTGHGSYDVSRASGDFEVADGRIDLAEAAKFLAQIVPEPLAGWELGGTVTASGHVRLANDGFAGDLTLRLRDGVLGNSGAKISVDGMEVDLAPLDLAAFTTPPGQSLRVKSLRVGGVEIQGLDARFQVKSLHQVWIEAAGAGVFGGKVTIDPFAFDPSVVDYAVTLNCDGLRIDDVLALFPTANAKASGLADGRIPLHYGARGVSFSQGWLALKPGQSGTLQINQPGLLTSNLSPQNVAYPTLKEVEAGLLNLRVDTLRAEVYPADAPAGRSVQIIIAGRPQDPKVVAPVTFEVNVNGPVEKLIQWGLDSRMKFSTK